MWLKTFLFAVLMYAASVGYSWLYLGRISVAGLSESLAFAGGVLIGTSYALSGLTFFYNFLDSKLKYRKDLGLMGFYLASLYAITLVARYPDRYFYKLSEHLFDSEVLLGLTAMSIFVMMIIISLKSMAKRLGSYWRPLLRIGGYLAYLLLIIRAFILENASWQLWLENLNGFPPLQLILTIFALGVIMLRLVLEIAIRSHAKPKPAAARPSGASPTVQAPVLPSNQVTPPQQENTQSPQELIQKL